MLVALLVFVGLLLAYANGANDNSKGVATLVGSGTTGLRRALLWATVATALGSATALVVARGLIDAFQGKGLVPADVAGSPAFATAVGLGTGMTVLLATRLGLPVSTTHAMLGALVGAGLVVSPNGVDGAQLANAFVLPLLVSPFLAVAGALVLYPLLSSARTRLGVSQSTGVYLEEPSLRVVPEAAGAEHVLRSVSIPRWAEGNASKGRVRFRDSPPRLEARPCLDGLHFLSAGAVSFARGVNDTPKIAALLLVGPLVAPAMSLALVGAAMAIGGMIGARRVARTMSHRVTEMNPGQGFVANLVTAGLVIGASRLGLPVSTTHVSCGSLFGIGAVTGRAHWSVIARIVGAWVITLPIAGMLGAIVASWLPHGAGSP